MDSISLVLMSVTMLLLIATSAYVFTIRQKAMLRHLFLALNSALIVWSIAAVMETVVGEGHYMFMFWENLTYVGASYVPVLLLLVALCYVYADKGLKTWHWLLLFFPTLTQLIIWTNDWHHLFYVYYSINAADANVYGIYFVLHAVYSYGCVVLGLVLLTSFAIRNTGKVSMQAVLIILGNAVPLSINILYTLNLFDFSVYSTPIGFSVTSFMYLLAMFKFNLLRITPIALQAIVNRISDIFFVVDEFLNVIDYNKAFIDQFGQFIHFTPNDRFMDILEKAPELPITPEECLRLLGGIFETGQSRTLEWKLSAANPPKYYTMEATPIQNNRGKTLAVVVLFKDITQHVENLKTIRDNQTVLMERERLASLGQLVGGIAHNLRTPIMAVSGGIDQMHYYVDEYRSSIEDAEVTKEDHLEIAADMDSWLNKMKEHMSYMSALISAVKDQTATFSTAKEMDFALNDVFLRVQILLRHELVQGKCTLEVENNTDEKVRIRGDMNALIQILDNLIVNAIQAYENGGVIQLQAIKTSDAVCIMIKDKGKGISENVQKRLFKEMITTKGKYGTGLGLYLSYSTVKGMFRGDMWFQSTEGVGTEFFITIPA